MKMKNLLVTSVVISVKYSKDLDQQKVRDIIIPHIKINTRKFLINLDPKEIFITQLVNLLLVGQMVTRV